MSRQDGCRLQLPETPKGHCVRFLTTYLGVTKWEIQRWSRVTQTLRHCETGQTSSKKNICSINSSSLEFNKWSSAVVILLRDGETMAKNTDLGGTHCGPMWAIWHCPTPSMIQLAVLESLTDTHYIYSLQRIPPSVCQ